MKVYVREWTRKAEFVTVATVQMDAYQGVSFYNTQEPTATTVNLKGYRVTAVYMHASENALCVYVERLEETR